jgi:hypothetical protein
VSDECDLLTSRPGHCDWCGNKLTGRRKRWCSRTCDRAFVANHRWTQAKAAAKKASTWFQCARCSGFFQQVEVNHIVPCKGRHGVWGCHHHLDNLEVLCKPCHLTTTQQQRKNGEFA